MTWALAVINLVTDIYLLAIPPFVISKLNIATQRKFTVSAIFLFDIVATTTSIISVYYPVAVSRNSMDFSWNIAPASVATSVNLCKYLAEIKSLAWTQDLRTQPRRSMQLSSHHERSLPQTPPSTADRRRRLCDSYSHGWSLQNLVSRVTSRIGPDSI